MKDSFSYIRIGRSRDSWARVLILSNVVLFFLSILLYLWTVRQHYGCSNANVQGQPNLNVGSHCKTTVSYLIYVSSANEK